MCFDEKRFKENRFFTPLSHRFLPTMSLQSDLLEEYLTAHSSAEPPLLAHLRREAHVHLLQPRMLSGHLQGRFLKMLVALAKPRNILEIGTYTAYATLCLAEGLGDSDGRVHTIEHNDEMEDFIRRSLALSPLSERISLHFGEAEDIIPSLVATTPFDFVYMDADKRHYLSYYHLLIESLPTGALILADNTLWDGKVIQEPLPQDAQTQGILNFNELVAHDSRVEVVLLPLRDGLSLIRKLPN